MTDKLTTAQRKAILAVARFSDEIMFESTLGAPDALSLIFNEPDADLKTALSALADERFGRTVSLPTPANRKPHRLDRADDDSWNLRPTDD
jgi:hypothetical protein